MPTKIGRMPSTSANNHNGAAAPWWCNCTLLTLMLMLIGGARVLRAQLAPAPNECGSTRDGYYARCVAIADPLITQPHLVFPDNLRDIAEVCATWNQLVDCLKSYTERCFTVHQQKQFNKAVENPIESVHLMCKQPTYQNEYLKYASCIKTTITEQAHCGGHYNLLVEQVAQRDVISRSTLCCSHERFRQCVYHETLNTCDQSEGGGGRQASTFSMQIIDKALSFLKEQCSNSMTTSEECSSIVIGGQPPAIITDPLTLSLEDEEDDDDDDTSNVIKKRPQFHRNSQLAAASPASTTIISVGSSSSSHQYRSRPSSYGRAGSSSSWPVEGRTTMSARGNPSYVASSPTAATNWQPSTDGVQHVTRPSLVASSSASSTETWYPAAGNQFDNEVEEPNQQSWTKPNGGHNRSGGAGCTTPPFSQQYSVVVVSSAILIGAWSHLMLLVYRH